MKTEPVLTIPAAITALWALTVALTKWGGVNIPEDVQTLFVPAMMAAMFLVRSKVTPVWRPKDNDGKDLVPDVAQDEWVANG